jgi:hypothetical protein
MKHSFTGFLALIMTFGVSAQVSKVDSVAILILDQMEKEMVFKNITIQMAN